MQLQYSVRNTHPRRGHACFGHDHAQVRHGGLQPDTVTVRLRGSAGQSLGAFAVRGVKLEVFGDANDYVGKGLSGGTIVVKPTISSPLVPEHNAISATRSCMARRPASCFAGHRGRALRRAQLGRRRRGRGAGLQRLRVHDRRHWVVLGDIGRNFGAGMSGGVAYVYDPRGGFANVCNLADVELESLDVADAGDDEEGRPTERAHRCARQWYGHLIALRRPAPAHLDRTPPSDDRQRLCSPSFENWDSAVGSFVKVMPKDFRRALLDQKAEGAAGQMAAAE